MPVGVVTNGNHHQQTSKINRIGLEPLLDRIFSSEQTNHAKPAPQAFIQSCKSMQISPAQTLYVGDFTGLTSKEPGTRDYKPSI